MQKSTLIIGGTRGIGLELAKAALGAGDRVRISGRETVGLPIGNDPNVALWTLHLDGMVVGVPSMAIGTFDRIFWVAGALKRGPFHALSNEEIFRLTRLHLSGPAIVLGQLIDEQVRVDRPFHLVTIGSTTAWKVRADEALYGALKAAKAQLTRNLGRELPALLPGSKVLLANPGGLRTGAWDGMGIDTSAFMDPAAVAKIVWDEAEAQTSPFAELQILRRADGSPQVEHGPRLPE